MRALVTIRAHGRAPVGLALSIAPALPAARSSYATAASGHTTRIRHWYCMASEQHGHAGTSRTARRAASPHSADAVDLQGTAVERGGSASGRRNPALLYTNGSV